MTACSVLWPGRAASSSTAGEHLVEFRGCHDPGRQRVIARDDCTLERNRAREVDDRAGRRGGVHAVHDDDIGGVQPRDVHVASRGDLAAGWTVEGGVHPPQGCAPQADSVQHRGRHMAHDDIGARCCRGEDRQSVLCDRIQFGEGVRADIRPRPDREQFLGAAGRPQFVIGETTIECVGSEHQGCAVEVHASSLPPRDASTAPDPGSVDGFPGIHRSAAPETAVPRPGSGTRHSEKRSDRWTYGTWRTAPLSAEVARAA